MRIREKLREVDWPVVVVRIAHLPVICLVPLQKYVNDFNSGREFKGHPSKQNNAIDKEMEVQFPKWMKQGKKLPENRMASPSQVLSSSDIVHIALPCRANCMPRDASCVNTNLVTHKSQGSPRIWRSDGPQTKTGNNSNQATSLWKYESPDCRNV